MASMVGVADGCGVRLVLGSGPFEADFSAAEGAVAYCLDFDFHSWPYGAATALRCSPAGTAPGSPSRSGPGRR